MFRLRDLRGGKRLLSSRIPPFLSLIQPTQQVSARQLFFLPAIEYRRSPIGKKKLENVTQKEGGTR